MPRGLFRHTLREAVLMRLIPDTANLTGRQATRPMHTATQTAAHHHHHHTTPSFVQRQEQATSQPATLAGPAHYSIRQHRERHFSASSGLLFFPSSRPSFIVDSGSSSESSKCHPFLRGPAPRQRYSVWSTASLLLAHFPRSSCVVLVSTASRFRAVG
ncbi:hypothetical protein ACQKWADRAFT_279445 [Trichoderma austrokoningii]